MTNYRYFQNTWEAAEETEETNNEDLQEDGAEAEAGHWGGRSIHINEKHEGGKNWKNNAIGKQDKMQWACS